MLIHCPSCHGTKLMEAMKIQPPGRPPVIVDACFDCGGVWFDRGELDRASKVRAHREPTPYEGELRCPRCGVPTYEELLGHERSLAWSCFKCKGVFVTGDGVDAMLKLHRTAAVGKAAQPPPPAVDRDEVDFICKRCGAAVRRLPYSNRDDDFIDRPFSAYCSSCDDDTSVSGSGRLDRAVASGLIDAVFKLFG